jgi:hypothetical protein
MSIWNNSTAKADAERAVLQEKFEKDCAEMDARHRKMDRVMNILIATCLLALGVSVVTSVFRGNTLDSKNDVCIEAGGVFVKTYGGFKCYSTDFRQELVIQ